MARLVCFCLAFSTVGAWPSPALAQKDAFARGVWELAAAMAASDSPQTARLAGAVEPMAAALAAWDRDISAFEARVSHELTSASAQRASQLRVELGRAYLERGRLSDALREFEAASAAAPAESDLHLLRGLALHVTGHATGAATAFRTAWDADHSNPIAAYYALRSSATPSERARTRAALANAYRRLARDNDQPRAPFPTIGVIPDGIARTPVVADSVTARGVAFLVAHKYTEAVAALRADLKVGLNTSDSPIAHFARGRTHEEANRISEARREFDAAGAGTLVGRSVLYAGIGHLAQVEGDFAGSSDAVTRALDANPNNANVRKQLARAYEVQDRLDEAFAELVAALLIDPRDAQAHAAVGQMFLDAGRDADAVTALTRALELAPGAYEPRYALATALTRLGRTTEAARELEVFERARVEMLERHRRQIAGDVKEEEARRVRLGAQGESR